MAKNMGNELATRLLYRSPPIPIWIACFIVSYEDSKKKPRGESIDSASVDSEIGMVECYRKLLGCRYLSNLQPVTTLRKPYYLPYTHIMVINFKFLNSNSDWAPWEYIGVLQVSPGGLILEIVVGL